MAAMLLGASVGPAPGSLCRGSTARARRSPPSPAVAASHPQGAHQQQQQQQPPSGLALCRRQALLGAVAGLSQLLQPDHARAFGTSIPLENLTYEVEDCAGKAYLPKKKGYKCLAVSGTAKVPGKDLEAADVFGFVTDSQNNSALAVNPDGTTRTVVAGVDKPLKGGGAVNKVEFKLVVSEDALAHPPLSFKNFKINPSIKSIEDHFGYWTACELDPASDDCLGLE